jgi:hypothetical protein
MDEHLRCAVCNRVCDDNHVSVEIDGDAQLVCDRCVELPEATIKRRIKGEPKRRR